MRIDKGGITARKISSGGMKMRIGNQEGFE